ncbi:ATP-binding protein [Haloglomus litoreum]|uniref:ATP-binding protein n=1 Tax=Haloglomus litoreum TaxID=3034026 RepID=UPI0023E7D5D2|nr:ATP-binding protein [Haloglomus sp. DT116]
MSVLTTLVAVGLDAAAVTVLGWVTWVAFRSRERPSAGPFVAIVATLTLWTLFSLAAGLPVVRPDSHVSTLLQFGEIGCALFVPGLWTLYTLGYTGRGTGLTRRRVLMLAGITLPVVLGGVVLALAPSASVAEKAIASLVGTELLYLLAVWLYGTYLLVGLARRHGRVSGPQVALLVLGVGAPYLLGAMGQGETAANGVTLGHLLAGGLLGVAVWRYPVLTGFPKADHVARSRVVEDLQEAVVVIDWDGRILDANDTTARLFDRDPGALVGTPIESVADGIAGHDLSAGATGTVGLRTTRGRRRFQFSVSAVGSRTAEEDRDGDPVARAVLFRDVTERRTREQRLTVLNRVLRHNVRNELDIVLAHADRIDDPDLRRAIRGSATDLVDLSDRAREAEELMSTSVASPARVDLADVAATVVEQYRDGDHDGEISVDCPDALVLRSHRRVLERVVSELVDNALAHAGPSPHVEIIVRAREGAAELTVADDGPGIPERERRLLEAGDETPLEHGRGIGLWFVNWAVTQLGAELEFGENDPRGSRVTVRLHGVGVDP